MSSSFTWKSGIFKNNFELFSGASRVGELINNSWSQVAEGELNNKKYVFRTRGFLEQETRIVDAETDTAVGKITYNFWRTTARIEFSDTTYNWETKNIWNSQWIVLGDEGFKTDFRGSLYSTGNINFDHQNDLLILCGLFVANYFWQYIAAFMIAIFLPIFLSTR